jgi:glycosyltransferase involved in cell wall biosynthesis
MRILHVVYECQPGRHRGGVQKMVHELACAQVKLGHHVEIATTAADGIPGREDDPRGLTIHRFKEPPGLRYRYAPSMGRRMRRSGERFDVVHAHNTFSPLNVTARRLARAWGARFFVHSHGALAPALLQSRSFDSIKKHSYIRLVELPTLNAASCVIALSEAEATWLRAAGVTSRIEIVASGIAPIVPSTVDEITAFRRKFRLEADSPNLLYIGRIVPKKNLEMILRAAGQLSREQPPLTLLVAGDRREDPRYVAELDDLVDTLDIGDVVRWLGFLDESEKAAAYASSNLFLHASLSEGMPMAVLEAMVAGMACVVTPGTMMGDAASEGAVVQRDRLPEFIDAIRELVTDSRLSAEVSERASTHVSERSSWNVVASRICALYEAVDI